MRVRLQSCVMAVITGKGPFLKKNVIILVLQQGILAAICGEDGDDVGRAAWELLE